jgi:DNA processing protein
VVEAMEKGGALITAHLAVDYFRDVFALPGSIHQKTSVGCNELIRKNLATIVTSGKQTSSSMAHNYKGHPVARWSFSAAGL